MASNGGPRRRLDAEMSRRGIVDSREKARQLIDAGKVTVAGAVAEKPSRMVAPSEPLEVLGEPSRYVSRGGEKLDAAIRRFTVRVEGRRAVDLGASTGGFTDCLLSHGASSVVAVDVGRNQLHERLRADRRVVVLERTHVRDVDPAALGGPFELVVADLSFISLRPIAPLILERIAAPGSDVVLLVKPQFEAGRQEASRARGVIRDQAVRERTLAEVSSAYEASGAIIVATMESPIRGADGNLEYLLYLRAPTSDGRGLLPR